MRIPLVFQHKSRMLLGRRNVKRLRPEETPAISWPLRSLRFPQRVLSLQPTLRLSTHGAVELPLVAPAELEA